MIWRQLDLDNGLCRYSSAQLPTSIQRTRRGGQGVRADMVSIIPSKARSLSRFRVAPRLKVVPVAPPNAVFESAKLTSLPRIPGAPLTSRCISLMSRRLSCSLSSLSRAAGELRLVPTPGVSENSLTIFPGSGDEIVFCPPPCKNTIDVILRSGRAIKFNILSLDKPSSPILLFVTAIPVHFKRSRRLRISACRT